MPFANCIALIVSIGAPWLSPLTFGPSAAVAPWLISLASVACVATNSNSIALIGTLNKSLLSYLGLLALTFAALGIRVDAYIELVTTMIACSSVPVIAMWTANRLNYDQRISFFLMKIWLVVAYLSCGFAGLQYLSLAQLFEPWISSSGEAVAYANMRQRNQFASLCSIGFICVLFLHQNASLTRHHNIVRQTRASVLAWLGLVALAVGNSLSSSRTGAVQWALIIAAVMCWRSSMRADVRRLAYGGFAIYALMLALMPWFAQWVGNSNTGLLGRAQELATTSGGRMALYSNVIDLIAMKPWFGWGWRELAYAHYSTHFDVRFIELLDNAHNLPLHLAVELGVPFAVLFCGAVLWWVVRSAPWRETDPTRQLAWGILMLIGVHSMVEYPLWYGPFLMTLGICVGMLQRPKKEQNSAVVQVFIAPIAIKVIAVALLCITAYLAFDYHRVSQIYLSEEDRSALYRDDVMGAAKRSVVFKKHAQFAELVTTPVTPQTAPHVLELALKLVHFSPEPRVIEPLIESATMLHFDDIAMFHLERYKAMYPKDYAAWSAIKK